mmetsp:Transcript_5366/g.11655  ORF Transcript_5366/g.11655 Transcript_5366/m.11655 type:complete len:203 (-) Transcript_5366:406-1014(-)
MTPATFMLCVIDSETVPLLESSILISSPTSLMARLAMVQNSCSMPTTTSLIMVAMPKSPPPCLGSASDSSSRTMASNLARSYLLGKVGRHGTAMPFSSTDTASGNMNSSGAKRRFLHSFRKAVWSARRPVPPLDPSVEVSPWSAIHSLEENTAWAEEDDAEGAPAPRKPMATPLPPSPPMCVQASAVALKSPPPAASSALLK